MQIRIYYEDTDCGGIVYHTNYIKFCERARSELFFAQGKLPHNGTCGFVVSSLEAQFLGSARIGDLLEVHTKPAKIGKVQMILIQEIFKIQDAQSAQNTAQPHTNAPTHAHTNDKIFSATFKMGYIDVAQQKPTPIPREFLDIFRTQI
ncbi:YbgC/FadM family acyl-CoA thioesterase [uncultured Helicobacter sp.]|uniref:YbgC/FadM family acyl-CoA thioesterase n=1 Tax=uncultured Helicobacter sp. TaxID=175537 RepID=UPI00258A28E1|nr:YbgC/FadM family acyl-CoA thioesterase [uncultured Helicobacter sp.]